MTHLGHTNADRPRLHTGVAGGGGGSQSSASPAVDEAGRSKITFDLASIDGTGLTGPPDGRVAVDYEFCVPATPAHLAEVRRIDPTVRAYPRGRGRIGCGPGQTLCIGSTHQRGWRAVLVRLAALEYVARVDRHFAE